jgi:hypothetical protein
MPKKERWISIQAISLLVQMWEEKPRNHAFTLAVVRLWVGYVADGPSALKRNFHKDAASYLREFVREARPHYSTREWRITVDAVTIELSKRLGASATSQVHQAQRAQ